MTVKRAKTAFQRERNDALIKAKDKLSNKCTAGEAIEIDWVNRRVLVNTNPAFEQKKDESSGSFLSPFHGNLF